MPNYYQIYENLPENKKADFLKTAQGMAEFTQDEELHEFLDETRGASLKEQFGGIDVKRAKKFAQSVILMGEDSGGDILIGQMIVALWGSYNIHDKEPEYYDKLQKDIETILMKLVEIR